MYIYIYIYINTRINNNVSIYTMILMLINNVYMYTMITLKFQTICIFINMNILLRREVGPESSTSSERCINPCSYRGFYISPFLLIILAV